ncbi:hypothetical protein DL93DRAFT_2081020 [Clavulina sp. PMI_390]|nr:hypothetical protein DL93DRAFT_2081020 [Clavulina sp. PMI_390]
MELAERLKEAVEFKVFERNGCEALQSASGQEEDGSESFSNGMLKYNVFVVTGACLFSSLLSSGARIFFGFFLVSPLLLARFSRHIGPSFPNSHRRLPSKLSCWLLTGFCLLGLRAGPVAGGLWLAGTRHAACVGGFDGGARESSYLVIQGPFIPLLFLLSLALLVKHRHCHMTITVVYSGCLCPCRFPPVRS